MPGQPKMVSVMTAPPTSVITSSGMIVASGISELRNA